MNPQNFEHELNNYTLALHTTPDHPIIPRYSQVEIVSSVYLAKENPSIDISYEENLMTVQVDELVPIVSHHSKIYSVASEKSKNENMPPIPEAIRLFDSLYQSLVDSECNRNPESGIEYEDCQAAREFLQKIKILKQTFHVEQFAWVSTGHITQKDGQLIQESEAPYRLAQEDEGLSTFFYITPDDDRSSVFRKHGFSEHFIKLFDLVQSAGLSYIRLDGQGLTVEGLDSFEW